MRAVSIVVAEYLSQNRRLTIANMGSFMRRAEGGEVIFSSFLKIDDGVLRALLMSEGATHEQADDHVAAFVEWVSKTIEEQGSVELKGLGMLKSDAAGEWSLTGDELPALKPQPQPQPEPEQQPIPMPEPQPIFEQRDNGRRRSDPFILLSVLVAVLALGVMIYGFVSEWLVGNIELPESLDRVMVKVAKMLRIY